VSRPAAKGTSAAAFMAGFSSGPRTALPPTDATPTLREVADPAAELERLRLAYEEARDAAQVAYERHSAAFQAYNRARLRFSPAPSRGVEGCAPGCICAGSGRHE
jgi:hypothetical protein